VAVVETTIGTGTTTLVMIDPAESILPTSTSALCSTGLLV
jgi:hypothetical protein